MIEAMKAAHRDVAMKCAFLRGLSAKEGKAFLATGRERRISADTFLLPSGRTGHRFLHSHRRDRPPFPNHARRASNHHPPRHAR